ncbi:hypothetical protein E2C01_080297 [Portunus trituberculatus]|uniref:Uncharacterized protein n=1 Tax=Portunus trituberculatus TaxID=210409 RepID=A0A5B7IY07_PORTR|nr:hypothetical protein [Portunus trituberculatus]
MALPPSHHSTPTPAPLAPSPRALAANLPSNDVSGAGESVPIFCGGGSGGVGDREDHVTPTARLIEVAVIIQRIESITHGIWFICKRGDDNGH